MAAAKTVAAEVSPRDLELGRIYPPLTDIRRVSTAIAVAVAEVAYAQRLADGPRPADLGAHVESLMYRGLITPEITHSSDVRAKLETVTSLHPRKIIGEVVRVGSPCKRVVEIKW